MMKIVKHFCPSLGSYSEFEELLDKEFSLVLSIKNFQITNHEAYMTLYQENQQPFSLTASVDPSKFYGNQKSEWVFANIPMKVLLTSNLCLIINIIEKRRSKTNS